MSRLWIVSYAKVDYIYSLFQVHQHGPTLNAQVGMHTGWRLTRWMLVISRLLFGKQEPSKQETYVGQEHGLPWQINIPCGKEKQQTQSPIRYLVAGVMRNDTPRMMDSFVFDKSTKQNKKKKNRFNLCVLWGDLIKADYTITAVGKDRLRSPLQLTKLVLNLH